MQRTFHHLPRRPRHGRTVARAVTFLVAFTAFLLVVVFGYLLPALAAAKDAAPEERKRLAATGPRWTAPAATSGSTSGRSSGGARCSFRRTWSPASSR